MATDTTLTIRNFAQIGEVNLRFGDLTVLVGAQGTGKSLALQWFKAVTDGRQIVQALRDAGQYVSTPEVLIDLVFGVGMGSAWRSDSEVILNGVKIRAADIRKQGRAKESMFYIPAHRAMLISDGWAAPFQKLTSETPVVARIFSQNLFERFSARSGNNLFPIDRVLKREFRELIDDAVFHGGTVGLEEDQQHTKRLKLTHGNLRLPFMTWTAGQREFTPLLLGLYHLLPPRNRVKQPDIDWVVIEEPEMGLHPKAVTAVILLTLDLLWRGYRVVLSTHHPHVLTAMWMLRNLRERHGRWELLCQAFGVKPSQQLRKVAESALRKSYYVHSLEFGAGGMVHANDISGLDPDSPVGSESGWGGLTEFSSRFGEVVREAVNESNP